MKRTVFVLIVFAALLSWTANAQTHFGVKAGINMSSIDRTHVKDNLGYQAGLVFHSELPLWFSLQPELLFHVKGARVTDLKNGAFGLGYLEVPVNVQWGPYFMDRNIRVFVQGTPFIGYAISKDMKDASGNDYDWKNINRFEYGAGAGVGVKLWAFQLTCQYNWNFGKLADAKFADLVFHELLSRSNFSGYTISLAIIF